MLCSRQVSPIPLPLSASLNIWILSSVLYRLPFIRLVSFFGYTQTNSPRDSVFLDHHTPATPSFRPAPELRQDTAPVTASGWPRMIRRGSARASRGNWGGARCRRQVGRGKEKREKGRAGVWGILACLL